MKRLRFVLEVHRATQRIGLFLESAEPPLELSQGEAHLLAYLLEAGDTSLSELHAAFAHKRSTLTSYMDRLEAKRLVVRESRPEDRRSFMVSLTGPGRTLAVRVHRRLELLEAQVLERLGEEDVEGLMTGLDALSELERGASRPKRDKSKAKGGVKA
ncbi:MarR family transcriptional regulator [Myxococcus stipitatus]|uniref:MarR family winged helix-turn-helix transcriptional regulator n=1 Tax=Myxococcus stipitatus TaxID=83455 RepID=UPI003144D7EF